MTTYTNVATLQDDETTIKIDWVGGNYHIVWYLDSSGEQIKSGDMCSSIGEAFQRVYEFAAYEHCNQGKDYVVDVSLLN